MGAVGYAGLYLNRKKMSLGLVNVLGGGVGVVGLGAGLGVEGVEMVGVVVIGTVHYPLALLQLLIVLEYFTKRNYTVVLALALAGFTLGRILAYPLHSLHSTSPHTWWLQVLLPALLLYVTGFLLSSESPRFLIDHSLP